MLNLGQVKTGSKILFRDVPHEVLEANHLKMGRGGAKLVTKLRNLTNQSVIDYTFAGDEKLDEASLNYQSAQYLYRDGNDGHFMTTDTFETLSLPLPESRTKFLKEGAEVDLLIWQNRPLDVKLPTKATLKVSYTEPGFKGNTASATLKKATLETGAIVNVPLFISIGDAIVVSTQTGQYDARA